MNLTPEQLELLLCLLGALALGFLFGYLLSRAYARQRYEVELEELSDLLDTRDREVESSSAKYGQLKQHMAVQANELKGLNQKVVEAEDVMGQYKDNSKMLDDEKMELKSLLMQKEKRISSLIDEVDFSKNELLNIQNLVNEYKHVNTTHNEKLLVAQNEIEQNAKLNLSLVKKNEEHSTIVKTLEEQKHELDNKLQLLTKSNLEKENVINEYKKRTMGKETVERENQDLKAKVQSLSKSLEDTKAELVKPNTNELVELQQKYNHVQQSLESTKKEMAQKDESLATVQKSFSDMKREIAEKEVSIATLQKEKGSLEAQTKTIQTQQSSNNESLQNEILNIKAELFRKDKKLKLAEEKLQLNQPVKSALSEKNSSYLSENDSSKEGKGFIQFVKNTFGSGDKNK